MSIFLCLATFVVESNNNSTLPSTLKKKKIPPLYFFCQVLPVPHHYPFVYSQQDASQKRSLSLNK